VQLKNERIVPGELMLISTGIRSRIELPRQAGLEINRGVVVDQYLRTSAADVYAAGDVAEFDDVVYGIIPAAIEQARAAAANMIDDQSLNYTGTIPATTLKVVGIDLTSVGDATVSGDEYDIVRQAVPEAQVYKRLTLRDGAVVGAILMGDRQNVLPIKQLISSGRDVSAYRDQLLDDGFDLSALAKGSLPQSTD
jgi:nitrite reductase (NADH) large subunit